jgi:hypothetical protein
MLSRIQVHNARIEGLTGRGESQDRLQRAQRDNIPEYLIDSAVIFAAAAQAFDYARGETDGFPTEITWGDVRNALSIFHVREDEFPQTHATIRRREERLPNPL